MKPIFFSIVFLFLLASCEQAKKSFDSISDSSSAASTPSNVKLAPKDYLLWNEDPKNGMISEKNIGDFSFSVFYKTPEYLAVKELSDDTISKEEFTKHVKEYEGMQYFSFKIQALNSEEELLKVGLNSENDYYSRIEYFSFKMQKDFKLIEGKDTLDCKLFHFERNYGLAPNATFTMGFESNKKYHGSKSFLYEDKIFNSGNVYLVLKEKNLSNVPQISI
jgi:hypothetical protein